MMIKVELGENSYDIVLLRSALEKAAEFLNLERRVLVLTDTGVPKEYAQKVASQCKDGTVMTVEQGESSKSFATLESVLTKMLSLGFTRKDAVVAVGGGVVGDLAGFCASIYMRGIDFYNIPTTVLSQVDSSVGGKTAVNLGKIKNIVGSFYQPKRVLIDTEMLRTLPARQISNGLSEALKMSLTSDKELFELFETGDPQKDIDLIIEHSVRTKAYVVEKDEKEAGLRKILNFGHTIGHGIESFSNLHDLYHGECVALGMIPMCSDGVRERLIPVLKKLNLPTSLDFDKDAVLAAMSHDKKMGADSITVTEVEEIGSFVMKEVKLSDLEKKLSLIKE